MASDPEEIQKLFYANSVPYYVSILNGQNGEGLPYFQGDLMQRGSGLIPKGFFRNFAIPRLRTAVQRGLSEFADSVRAGTLPKEAAKRGLKRGLQAVLTGKGKKKKKINLKNVF